jgi:hypothetical protein
MTQYLHIRETDAEWYHVASFETLAGGLTEEELHKLSRQMADLSTVQGGLYARGADVFSKLAKLIRISTEQPDLPRSAKAWRDRAAMNHGDLLNEIERLTQPCPRCASNARDDAIRESMQRGEWGCDNCSAEGDDPESRRRHEEGTLHTTRMGRCSV